MREDTAERPVDYRLLLPVLLTALALFLLVGLQTVQLVRDHSALLEFRTSQQANVDAGEKLRQQLQALAGQTAEGGDAAAKDVVEEMRKQGFTLSPPKQ
jgi:predicted RND superfamily exporter protein